MDSDTEREIVMDALGDVLADIDQYEKNHYGRQPLREETISKVKAALRLLAKEDA